jgi:hypothetical protein
MSYDNAKACAVVEAPSSGLSPNNNNINNNLDMLDEDQGLDNLVTDSNPKGNLYNNHYGEKGKRS